MVFAMVTRASFGARLNWPQSLDWCKLSRIMRGLAPCEQEEGEKSAQGARRGFEKIVQEQAPDDLRGMLPVQPGDKSRVWGVNSFATLPMFGGVFREDAAQKCGFRTPVSSRRGVGTHSGLWLTAVDPDAAATAPGVAPHVKGEAAGVEASTVCANAVISGKLSVKWPGNCANTSKETQVLVENALEYAGRYALEAGFRRRNSRVGIPNSRAGWFVRDVPENMGNAEWRFYEAAGSLRLPPLLRVAP